MVYLYAERPTTLLSCSAIRCGKSFYYILPPMSMFIKIRWFDLKSGESFQNAVIIDFFNSYEIRLVNNSNVGHF